MKTVSSASARKTESAIQFLPRSASGTWMKVLRYASASAMYTENCYVSVYFDDERISRRKKQIVAPGEMEEIHLTREQLLNHPGLQTVTLKIEEA